MKYWILRKSLLFILIGGVILAWYFLVYHRLAGWQRYYTTHHVERVKQGKLLPLIQKRVALLSTEKKKFDRTYDQLAAELKAGESTFVLNVSRAIGQCGLCLHKANEKSFTFSGALEQIHAFFDTELNVLQCLSNHVVLISCDESNFECTAIMEISNLEPIDKKALQLKKAEGLGG